MTEFLPPPKLPRKQLATLALCRFAQPLALASSYPYLPEYIEWQGVPGVQVAAWLGIFVAAFSCFEAGCALPWAHFSDRYGRKPTILLSQALLLLAYVGLGFSRSIWLAIVFICAAGAGNGNIGVLRTIVAEIVPQKELQTAAFAVLPTTAALGGILGPLFGGNLADPVKKYPQLFSQGSLFETYPFALPNLFIGVAFLPGILATILVLQETTDTRSSLSCRKARRQDSSGLAKGASGEEGVGLMTLSEDHELAAAEEEDDDDDRPRMIPKPEAPERIRSISHFSNPYLWINAILGFHSSGFDNLIPVFLHLPHQNIRESLFRFANGFGKGSAYIGAVLTACGLTAITATLLLYPRLAKRFGQVNCLRASSTIFPVVYFLMAPTVELSPRWLSEASLIFCICSTIITTVALKQACIFLLSNSVDGSDLARLNGLNVTVASISRGLGGIIVGFAFSAGVAHGYVMVPFWILTIVACIGAVLVYRVRDSRTK